MYCLLARLGGIVALEDWDKGSRHYNPPAPALDKRIMLIDQAFSRVSELDGGRTHLGLFTSVGIEAHLHAGVLALPAGHPYLRLPIQMTTSLAPRRQDLVSAEAGPAATGGVEGAPRTRPLGHHVHGHPVLGPAALKQVTRSFSQTSPAAILGSAWMGFPSRRPRPCRAASARSR